MWRKILAIVWKDNLITFTDRTLLVTMLVTPLILSTIIGLAFGGASGGDLTFEDIPVAVVNLDAGSDTGGQPINYGELLADILADNADTDAAASDNGTCALVSTDDGDSDDTGQTLGELFNVTALDDEAAARAAVDSGDYAAAVIIPADFSAQLAPQIDTGRIGETSVTVYGSAGLAVSANIVRTVVSSVVDQLALGNITIAATIGELVESAQDGNLYVATGLVASQAGGTLGPDFSCAFTYNADTVSIDTIPLDSTQAQSNFVQVLLSIGAAQAVFFMLFTGQFGVQDLFYEARNGTLKRLTVSPTPRWGILVGKLGGVVISLLVQLGVLLISLTAIASLVEQTPLFIWGSNIPVLLALIAVITLTVMGIGVILAGFTSTPEQVQVIGPILNATLAAMGGAFGFSLPVSISQFSPVYWAVDGFTKLAGGRIEAMLPNLAVLGIAGSVLLIVGLWRFGQRVEL